MLIISYIWGIEKSGMGVNHTESWICSPYATIFNTENFPCFFHPEIEYGMLKT